MIKKMIAVKMKMTQMMHLRRINLINRMHLDSMHLLQLKLISNNKLKRDKHIFKKFQHNRKNLKLVSQSQCSDMPLDKTSLV
jgi:hypothetical protein